MKKVIKPIIGRGMPHRAWNNSVVQLQEEILNGWRLIEGDKLPVHARPSTVTISIVKECEDEEAEEILANVKGSVIVDEELVFENPEVETETEEETSQEEDSVVTQEGDDGAGSERLEALLKELETTTKKKALLDFAAREDVNISIPEEVKHPAAISAYIKKALEGKV